MDRKPSFHHQLRPDVVSIPIKEKAKMIVSERKREREKAKLRDNYIDFFRLYSTFPDVNDVARGAGTRVASNWSKQEA